MGVRVVELSVPASLSGTDLLLLYVVGINNVLALFGGQGVGRVRQPHPAKWIGNPYSVSTTVI